MVSGAPGAALAIEPSSGQRPAQVLFPEGPQWRSLPFGALAPPCWSFSRAGNSTWIMKTIEMVPPWLRGPTSETAAVWQEPVTFEDVAVYLSHAEWDAMAPEQRELYCSVMLDNYQLLASLGKAALLTRGDTAGARGLPWGATPSELRCFQRWRARPWL